MVPIILDLQEFQNSEYYNGQSIMTPNGELTFNIPSFKATKTYLDGLTMRYIPFGTIIPVSQIFIDFSRAAIINEINRKILTNRSIKSNECEINLPHSFYWGICLGNNSELINNHLIKILTTGGYLLSVAYILHTMFKNC